MRVRKKQDTWILVADALPEAFKEVIVCIHGPTELLVRVGFYADDGTWSVHHLPEPVVTHWAPLPEAPKAGMAYE